jgi:hypothetical protein
MLALSSLGTVALESNTVGLSTCRVAIVTAVYQAVYLPGLSVADPWMPSVCAPSVPHSLSVQQFLELPEVGGHRVPGQTLVPERVRWTCPRCVPRAILQGRKSPPGRRLGGLFGGGYWGSSSRTLAAWAPFGPDVTSNSTAWPSSSER